MGYKTLLTDYMRHVEEVLGSNLVEVAALTNAVNARQLGELRSIAAQIKRESYDQDRQNELNLVVQKLLVNGDLGVQQLPDLEGFDLGSSDTNPPVPLFSRTLLNLVKFQETDP